MLTVHFILTTGETRVVSAEPGQTLLTVAKAHDIDIEGACGGAMACATCHVVVEQSWYDQAAAADDG